MWSSSVTKLSKQFATTQLRTSAISSSNVVVAKAATASDVWTISRQSFATNRKTLDAKNVKRLKIQAKKKKNLSKPAKSPEDDLPKEDVDQPFLQQQEWAKFQQSISVDGFQTGQITTAAVLKKGRGGKQARLRKEKELARLQQQQDVTLNTDEKFPAIRYSQEETERLLEQAYGALPERAGKRGTRNLQRQENRWQLVREIRSKYKAQIQAAHERRMEKRHWKRQQVIAAKEQAPISRAQDLEYQAQVLQRWADTMYGTSEEDAAVVEELESSEKVVSATSD
mmetsp:Transcript_23916/g.58452  ORF Transcript_23916/g.58452 Transcript_23916/m.58452 type:complete len:283 (+) Transcript_23916:91-939(+)|eukprot:CAMPEP_0113614276 /NCGR_PEP_ID=MMETSP0017_2-20120614/7079_1 /TAXON_ID=2856 /ORGANISM="Cylindrotheca closterium" /LENGTH=282 /DNA_ID=CAMNT_0000523431 /DNA_START=91 /DNA_END=939 /DNA_ORIENTATION=+ /assembly_acc=CAM_ASM_000147